jgi:ABC-type oligopeptide transport system substrate-binding subunit
MKNKIMQLAAAVILGGAVIVSSCTSSPSENTAGDTTANGVDTTHNAAVDSTAAESAPDTSAVK